MSSQAESIEFIYSNITRKPGQKWNEMFWAGFKNKNEVCKFYAEIVCIAEKVKLGHHPQNWDIV